MSGLCLRSSILFQATIKCSDSKYKQKRHKGICKTTLKKRYANHQKSFNLIKSKNDTTLSSEYWNLKKKQAPRLTWEPETYVGTRNLHGNSKGSIRLITPL